MKRNIVFINLCLLKYFQSNDMFIIIIFDVNVCDLIMSVINHYSKKLIAHSINALGI